MKLQIAAACGARKERGTLRMDPAAASVAGASAGPRVLWIGRLESIESNELPSTECSLIDV